MRRFITTAILSIGFAVTAASADAGAGRWGDDLRFVVNTSIPSDGDTSTMALCHLVGFADFIRVPIYTSTKGYALSSTSCSGTDYREVTPENFLILQANGLVPTDLPATPTTSLYSMVWGHAWLVLGGLGLLARGIGFGALAGRLRRPRKAAVPDTLAIHSLVAMSEVAVADGHIDDTEIHQIAQILTRLTGKSYVPEQVSDLLTRLNPSPSDIQQVGQDLSEKERQIVLEAALNVAVADGEIHPHEYAVVTDLAQRMRIGADQFRGALGRISAHLQTAQLV